ncbi:MAG TPA: hypothetical protein ENI19_02935 [Candidatus Nealsonbacteria bacterium]|uniref:DUF8128 domain-containing protein n=1 Tax=marine sediment metagenome TaxID=412755 RepID=A0A0F9X7N3_9ZZZZ|nr:hypothetical protein [Candidatus Nealsonbacteria bacterium]HEB46634.1 hypothetical protein [Candidatus Nealsonbacteria bacterium]
MPESLSFFLNSARQIIETWWWLVLPFLLFGPFLSFFLWWRNTVWLSKIKWVLLEIKLPKETMKPIKAMEYVMAGFHAIYDPPDWRQKWIDGQYPLWLSLEMVGLGGDVRFFIKTPDRTRAQIEAAIYAQYPDAEITEAKDYVNNVPYDLPNEEWDMWGRDLRLWSHDVYPIKTYPKFEEAREIKEEKRVDPLAAFLEGLSRLRPNEQLWFQIMICPFMGELDWKQRGEALINKIALRPEKKAQRPMIQEAADVLIFGQPAGERVQEERMSMPEMQLTYEEKERVKAIADKIAKPPFEVSMRMMYLAKRDIFFPAPAVQAVYGLLRSLTVMNLNSFAPWAKTRTRIMFLLVKRRTYLRKRRMLRFYKSRDPAPGHRWWRRYFKGGIHPSKKGIFVLNTEEVATLFHFPSKIVAPAPRVSRTEVKRKEAPPELPTE